MLDEKLKKCYYSTMDNNIEINQKIAKNLLYYRKAAGLTQAEVAERIHYSDKSVSKWESGNGVPDVYTLVQLAQLYGVNINAFLEEKPTMQTYVKSRWPHLLIMLLSIGIVWLVAVFSFALAEMLRPHGMWWLIYLYAVLASAIVLLVYAAIWKHRIINFLSVTTIIWMALLCCYLTVRVFTSDVTGLWSLFLLGVPLQVLEVLWTFFRSILRKQKGMVAAKVGKPTTTEEEKSEEAEKE